MTSDAPFLAAHAELRRALRRAKSSPQEVRALASMPFLKRCESCAREAADEPRRVPGREVDRWIGPACLRKNEMHGQLRRAIRARPGDGPRQAVFGLPTPREIRAVTERLRGAKLPADFQELAGDDDLALVVADGNGLGDWFEELELDGVESLSAAVDVALRRALDAAEGLIAAGLGTAAVRRSAADGGVRLAPPESSLLPTGLGRASPRTVGGAAGRKRTKTANPAVCSEGSIAAWASPMRASR